MHRPFYSMRCKEAVDHGDRTRLSTNDTSLADNDLRIRIGRLAGLCLQVEVTERHELARLVTVAESWSSLNETAKSAIENMLKPEP